MSFSNIQGKDIWSGKKRERERERTINDTLLSNQRGPNELRLSAGSLDLFRAEICKTEVSNVAEMKKDGKYFMT